MEGKLAALEEELATSREEHKEKVSQGRERGVGEEKTSQGWRRGVIGEGKSRE